MLTFRTEKKNDEFDAHECRNERITGELYRCLNNKKVCNYRYFAGNVCDYCMHPNQKEFSELSPK
jgi:hypothetical protein